MANCLCKAIVFLAALLVAGCLSYRQAPLGTSKSAMYGRMVNSVVVLPGCTGTVLRNHKRDIVVLTAAHCVRQNRMGSVPETYSPITLMADLNKKASCQGTILLVSIPRDLALIRAKECDLPTVATTLAKKSASLGETIYAVGHPLSISYVLTMGIVSRVSILLDGFSHMLISAPTIFGNSGGPCFDARGEMVGLVRKIGSTMVRMPDGRPYPLLVPVAHLGLVVPLGEIREFLKTGGFPELAK
jgi:S1-C subfamily serine protease